MKWLGPLLFGAGFIGFLAAGMLGSFELGADTLEQLDRDGVIQGHHRALLYEELDGLQGRRFTSVRAFSAEVAAAIDATNERLDGGSRIWDYDQGQYRFHVLRRAAAGPAAEHPLAMFLLTIVLASVGGLLCWLPGLRKPAGIKNDGVQTSSTKSRGFPGMLIGAGLIGGYIALYFYPETIVQWIALADPLSEGLRGKPADRWFFYGTLYTFTILVMGARMLINYRHNRYQIVRTLSVIFFQVGFAFLIPSILATLNRPEVDMKNAWPLDYSFFYSYRLDGATSGGAFGWFVLLWGLGLALIVIPAMAYFFGKRWYCSWVCGCGGLAETLGDPFRHLSNKSLKAWRVERWLVHSVLVFAVVMTGIVLVNYFSARSGEALLGEATGDVQKAYGFLIGSIFAGVVGTGFYPLMGNRVWCRFGCPLAAILGIVQRFKSRFRITTNGGQCISCGNCSTYCEMGIDVRAYAQRGQNIVRSSCVGCGVCAAVCPRGVLRLENGPEAGRFNKTSLLQIGDGRIDAV